MGRDAGDAGGFRIGPNELPAHLLAQRSAPDLAAAIHGSEHRAISNPGGHGSRIYRHLHPRRHRHGTDPAMLPDEIHDAPITLLDVLEGERRHFGAPQSAS